MVDYADRLLKTEEFNDWDGAVNGLQVENRGKVHRIAAAVDASLATLKMAVTAEADLLVVHHGLFWSETRPWTGKRAEMIRLLVEKDVAVYSSHLPLDAHPRVGNNAQLCKALGFTRLKPFFFERGRHLGLRTEKKISREDLLRSVERAVGAKPTLLPGGGEVCRRIGVVTGGAGNDLKIAARDGIDTFITGEGAHWTFALAEDLGINVIYGGHYATETFGVKALAADLSARFGLPWSFLDHPSGL